MSRRRAIVVGLMFVALLAGAVFVALRHPSEPAWEGRRLSDWTERHIPSSEAQPPYGSPGWHLADRAIKEIGTNGIPTLLRMSAATESDLRARLRRLATKQRFVFVNYRYAPDLNREAEYAFELLGTNAESAVPELIRIYQQARSPDSQMYAALSLGNIGKPAEPAVPVLISNFTHTNDQVRFYAVSAVGDIGGDSAIVVPAFRPMLKDSYRATRWNALVALTHFHRQAEIAIPDILEMQKREANDPELLQQVELAIWRIAPEKTPKALLVEKDSPLARTNVATADLIMEFEGRRAAGIKTGNPLPRLMQIWTSDPRGVVRLYRTSSDGEEIFLGGYEVLDLPPKPEPVHAYILAVVAEGNIYACARDVNGNRLLDVRKVE
jgi:hypothetical protein